MKLQRQYLITYIPQLATVYNIHKQSARSVVRETIVAEYYSRQGTFATIICVLARALEKGNLCFWTTISAGRIQEQRLQTRKLPWVRVLVKMLGLGIIFSYDIQRYVSNNEALL
jgi:hypothetical protein